MKTLTTMKQSVDQSADLPRTIGQVWASLGIIFIYFSLIMALFPGFVGNAANFKQRPTFGDHPGVSA